ncbi:MAG: hypothetical protein QM500_12465 [Methylococcales bacterium]
MIYKIVMTFLFMLLTHRAMAGNVPDNMSLIYGEVYSNKNGVLFLRLDESQAFGSLPDLSSKNIGKVIKVRCIQVCEKLKKNDYISGRLIKIDNKKASYILKRIHIASKPGYIY